jgi:hypothetical protein
MKIKGEKMKNKIFVTLVTTMIVLCLTSCDNDTEGGANSERGNSQERLVFDDVNRPLGERELATMIPDDIFTFLISGETTSMAVTDVTIERRQTNAKEDVVYAVIEMENDYAHRTTYYRLTINFYDVGGWQIDAFESYQSFVTIPINPPSDNFARSDTVSQYVSQGYEVSYLFSNTDNWENGESSFVFEVSREERFYSHVGTVTASVRFNNTQNGWSVDSVNPDIQSTLKPASLNEAVSSDMLGAWEGSWSRRDTVGGTSVFTFRLNVTEVTETNIHVSGRILHETWVDANAYDEPFNTILTYSANSEDNSYTIREEIPIVGRPNNRLVLTVEDGSLGVSYSWTDGFGHIGSSTLRRTSQ